MADPSLIKTPSLIIDAVPEGLIAVPSRNPLMVDLVLLYEHLLPALSKKWSITSGACIAASCIVSDTMRRLGYKAETLPVTFVTENRRLTRENPKQRSMLIIGDPDDERAAGSFRGHVVALVEGDGLSVIVDASLSQARRDWLPGLPDFLALPFRPSNVAIWKNFRNVLLAGFIDKQEDLTAAYYLLTTEDREEWRVAPDAEPARRKLIVSRVAEKIRKGRKPLMQAIEEYGFDHAIGRVLPRNSHEIYR